MYCNLVAFCLLCTLDTLCYLFSRLHVFAHTCYNTIVQLIVYLIVKLIFALFQRQPAPRVVAPPRQLAANSSISISKVLRTIFLRQLPVMANCKIFGISICNMVMPSGELDRKFVLHLNSSCCFDTHSQVDMSRPCNMCHVMLPSPAALIEHMNKNHFRCLMFIHHASNENVSQGSSWAEHCTARCASTTKPTRPSISWY